MHLVTNLGDLAVLLPASLGLIVFLLWIGAKDNAAAYGAAMVFCLLAALLAKLAFAACGARTELFGVESPSGHTAFSATFYGCLALLFAAGRPFARRFALYACAAALVLLIGVSRVALQAHTAPEVVVGLVIGAISIGLFLALSVSAEPLRLSTQTIARLSPFAALYALCLLLLAGHWSAERTIDVIAAELGADLRLCRSAEVGAPHPPLRAGSSVVRRLDGDG
jgi:membrane-associated phospholipid phosphatase